MNTQKTSRNCGLDIIRIFALFCVVSGHFFLISGYYDVFVRGPRMYMATLIRTSCSVCVPLFLMLSGYLMRKKVPSKQYYIKLSKIIAEYILASICCILYTAIRNGMPDDIILFVKKQIVFLFSYTAAPYGWYVGLYIGLYLLIPYLNMLYSYLNGQREKQKLIFTLLFLTAIPCVSNAFTVNFTGYEMDFPLLPEWWVDLYPITYYYLGAYLSEYPIKIKKSMNLLGIFLSFLVSGSFNFWKSYGHTYVAGLWADCPSIFIVVQSVLIFTYLSKISCKPNGIAAKVFAYLSDRCFCAYLVSYIFDDTVHRLSGWFENMTIYKLEYFAVSVPVVLFSSLLLSSFLHDFNSILQKKTHRLLKKTHC